MRRPHYKNAWSHAKCNIIQQYKAELTARRARAALFQQRNKNESIDFHLNKNNIFIERCSNPDKANKKNNSHPVCSLHVEERTPCHVWLTWLCIRARAKPLRNINNLHHTTNRICYNSNRWSGRDEFTEKNKANVVVHAFFFVFLFFFSNRTSREEEPVLRSWKSHYETSMQADHANSGPVHSPVFCF